MTNMNLMEFLKNKKIFITGHSGFKGTWLCKILAIAGAKVTGYALNPPTTPALFEICNMRQKIASVIGDVRDYHSLKTAFDKSDAEIVIHLAAQPIVREGYENPAFTYETNVMGTVNILECIRNSENVKSFLNVTTDKVYENNEWEWGYRENDILNGYDPYSNSKSCSELVTQSYNNCFFKNSITAISTARAGNVIGGGDFAKDRILPDCIRSAKNNETIIIRNPHATRPFQHVLEPLFAYLKIVMLQYEDKEKYSGVYNVGPNNEDCVTTANLATVFCEEWGNINWKNVSEENAVHEANFLKLDCSRIKNIMGIMPKWNYKQAIKKTVEWSKCYFEGKDVNFCMENQIKEYLED